MKSKKTISIILIVIVVMSFATLFFATYLYLTRHVKESDLYLAVSSYQEQTNAWKHPENVSFSENSGESLFLNGMDAFAQKDYDTAKDFFYKALEAPGSDPALLTYLYYYLNQCIYLQQGCGDFDIISLAMDAAGEYRPLANDEDMLWDLVSTISTIDGANVASDEKAILLMQDYLRETKNLELVTWAYLKNCIGLVQFFNEGYADSIQNFYDVKLKLENVKMTPDLKDNLAYAEEYIANIYYRFEDYEEAVLMYQELCDDVGEDNISHTYSYYLNMSTAYLKLSDLENAKKAVLTLEELLPHLDESIVLEVEASMNDVMANICMQEGNYDQAAVYIAKATAFYQEHEEQVFIGGESLATLSRCKYMIHEGELAEAQEILENFAANKNASDHHYEMEIYELLADIYAQTGQSVKQIAAYEHLLSLDDHSKQMTQREYLKFSESYREAKELEGRNSRLTLIGRLAFLATFVFAVSLIIVLFLIRHLYTKNMTDQLTGAYNRKKLSLLMHKYKRSGTPANLGVIIMDIDYFKRYNDTYGHPAGDDVLRKVAKVLLHSVRKNDCIIRYGGEEFLALLTEVDAQTAQMICQRIHDNLTECAIPHSASKVANYVTLSIGLCYQEQSNSAALDKLIEYADECLYQSKQAGRNKITAKEL